ncbi:MAG: hypothetical protein R3D46_10910 [Defluviimonas denitrificans]
MLALFVENGQPFLRQFGEKPVRIALDIGAQPRLVARLAGLFPVKPVLPFQLRLPLGGLDLKLGGALFGLRRKDRDLFGGDKARGLIAVALLPGHDRRARAAPEQAVDPARVDVEDRQIALDLPPLVTGQAQRVFRRLRLCRRVVLQRDRPSRGIGEKPRGIAPQIGFVALHRVDGLRRRPKVTLHLIGLPGRWLRRGGVGNGNERRRIAEKARYVQVARAGGQLGRGLARPGQDVGGEGGNIRRVARNDRHALRHLKRSDARDQPAPQRHAMVFRPQQHHRRARTFGGKFQHGAKRQARHVRPGQAGGLGLGPQEPGLRAVMGEVAG